MLSSNIETLLDVGMSYLEESCEIVSPQVYGMCQTLITCFLKKMIPFESACEKMNAIVGNCTAIEKLNSIMNVPDEPIQLLPTTNENALKQKTRPWSPQEDMRLLAGIYKFGLDSWNPIANFVGNGRTRSQCSQRWVRGLNPKISKSAWNPEEEKKLMQLVSLYGDKCWTKISSEIGNRSDVQCRYKYQQLKKDINAMSPTDTQNKGTMMGNMMNDGMMASFQQMSMDQSAAISSQVSAQLSAQTSLPSNQFKKLLENIPQAKKRQQQMPQMMMNSFSQQEIAQFNMQSFPGQLSQHFSMNPIQSNGAGMNKMAPEQKMPSKKEKKQKKATKPSVPKQKHGTQHSQLQSQTQSQQMFQQPAAISPQDQFLSASQPPGDNEAFNMQLHPIQQEHQMQQIQANAFVAVEEEQKSSFRESNYSGEIKEFEIDFHYPTPDASWYCEY